MGKRDEAIEQFRETLRLDPSRTDALNSLVQLRIAEAGEALKAGEPGESPGGAPRCTKDEAKTYWGWGSDYIWMTMLLRLAIDFTLE